jgi:hypothetical protein
MAGILFADDRFILAGYNPFKLAITGIGGKKEGDELPTQTAVRETLEELFELETIPEYVFQTIWKHLRFDNVLYSNGYTVFIMDFDALHSIITTVKVSKLKSKVYDKLPANLSELILMRKSYKNAELSHILLLPREEIFQLDRFFMKDISHLKTGL